MENFNKQKWEDLNLTRDEVRSIGEALKKEEFRTLLTEYVKEINDPNNRKQYEEEITQLENERGVDVKFIHPTSGYVIKTSVDGKTKAFINICTNNNVGVPFCSSKVEGADQGVHWSIPYCLAPPREDLDKKKKLCIVYDVVFHPDALALSKNNAQFKKLINDTALEGLEENFKVSFDKVNLKFPKMMFKGLKHPTVIRKKMECFKSSEFTEIPNYPYPPLREYTECDTKPSEINKNNSPKVKNIRDSKLTTPSYTIKHRNTIEMENFTNNPLCKMTATVPNELVIVIDLPLLKCSSEASVDVTENTLTLVSEKNAKYKLDLNLPYPVDKNKGCAKFDMSKKVLTVTLPVVKQGKNSLSNIDLFREDSGVESDNGNGRSNSTSSNEEEDSENVSVINKVQVSNNIGSQYREEKANVIGQVESFLKPVLHYSLPDYFCKFMEDVIIINFQVSNVNPESLKYRFFDNSSGFHLTFVSLGTGFFPVNYAVYFTLPPLQKIETSTFSIETHDNNLIAQVKLLHMSGMILTEYYIGTDQNNIERKDLPTIVQKVEDKTEACDNGNICSDKEICDTRGSTNINEGIATNIDESRPIYEENRILSAKSDNDGQKSQKEDTIGSTIRSQDIETSAEILGDFHISESTSSLDESSESPQRHSVKSRTVSESHQGEVKRNKYRGILKIGRSLSESSVDDYASWSSEKIEKTKKTVRFSDVISKQVFRMNSSILGQRKKNQRKTRNKKRAQERRLSESGNESEGDVDYSGFKEQDKEKNEDFWQNELESSSCDVSEVSDVSDISESDDGQKENGPPLLPCSSRKNHKRRGKKSARKNAATAKLNYMEY